MQPGLWGAGKYQLSTPFPSQPCLTVSLRPHDPCLCSSLPLLHSHPCLGEKVAASASKMTCSRQSSSYSWLPRILESNYTSLREVPTSGPPAPPLGPRNDTNPAAPSAQEPNWGPGHDSSTIKMNTVAPTCIWWMEEGNVPNTSGAGQSEIGGDLREQKGLWVSKRLGCLRCTELVPGHGGIWPTRSNLFKRNVSHSSCDPKEATAGKSSSRLDWTCVTLFPWEQQLSSGFGSTAGAGPWGVFGAWEKLAWGRSPYGPESRALGNIFFLIPVHAITLGHTCPMAKPPRPHLLSA